MRWCAIRVNATSSSIFIPPRNGILPMAANEQMGGGKPRRPRLRTNKADSGCRRSKADGTDLSHGSHGTCELGMVSMDFNGFQWISMAYQTSIDKKDLGYHKPRKFWSADHFGYLNTSPQHQAETSLQWISIKFQLQEQQRKTKACPGPNFTDSHWFLIFFQIEIYNKNKEL